MKIRVQKNSTLKLAVVSVLVLNSIAAMAQLNDNSRFRSKTRFNNPGNNNNKKAEFSDDKNNSQAFGERTKIPELPTNKFVNLNPETAFGPELITDFNFVKKDIMEVTQYMQETTGINLILDKDVKGTMTITSKTPITVGDAWKAYLAALNMAGYTLVKAGAFYKIINARDVRYVPTKIYTGSYTPETEAHIMKVMTLKFVDASEISRNFRPFMSRYGRIIDLKQTNTIIISDTGANIARLVKLIKFIDVPGHEESLQIIKVRNSSAIEIAKLLDEILRSGGSSSSRRTTRSGGSSGSSKRFSKSSGASGSQNISKIIAEPRTNSIIAMANADGAQELRNLIRKLDVKFSSTNSDKIHVHYLNYGNAEELAKTLSSLVSGAKSSSRSSNSGSSRTFISRGSDGSTLFNGEVKITADKNNNALVVTASATDWLTIKNVINKLDIPRDQVYVEGLIMETSANTAREFGVEYFGAFGSGGAQRAGFINSGTLATVAAGGTPAGGGLFVGGSNGPARTVSTPAGDLTLNPFNAMVKAVASNNNTNVLATPQILALDNTEAEFEVGATVPVREQSTASNGQTTNGFKSQEAKLSLKITPQINKVTRFVKLKINQTINDFVGELDTSGNGNATTTRSAVTEVMVRDKDTVVMGGLLRDRETVAFDKVPLLGDIPVLGWLFKRKSKKVEKVNLLMFMTPRILSPYDKTASANALRLMDERDESLKAIIDDENPAPFKDKAKELREKMVRQSQGPLYDTSPNEYQKTNEDNDGVNQGSTEPYQSFDINRDSQAKTNDDENQAKYIKDDSTPNYQKIADDIKAGQQNTEATPEAAPVEDVKPEIQEE